MTGRAPIVDFDAAYFNGGAIPGADAYPDRWRQASAAFRERLCARGHCEQDIPYGATERQRYDLFLPEGEPAGLVVFVHGGYWKAFDKSLWSHLARGAVERGHAVAVPSYALCPDARIAEIGVEIARFLDHVAARIAGPIRLSGHSAGGQLVARLAGAGSPISAAMRERIETVVSISGLHDLRPLMKTRMNEILRIDAAEALAESPAFLAPNVPARIVAYVGAAELPEFRRQNALLADIWHGLGARTQSLEAEGRHHFDVIDELEDPASRLTRILTGAPGD